MTSPPMARPAGGRGAQRVLRQSLRRAGGHLPVQGETDAKSVQKSGQLQPFIAVFPQECMGQLAYLGPS
jgi:hypothetical protein